MTTQLDHPSTNGFQPGLDYGTTPPEISFINDLLTRGKQFYEAFHSQCRVEDDYYYGRRAVPAPQDFDPIQPVKARAIINIATDHVDVNNISIEVPEASPRAKARAERIKKYLLGAWLHIPSAVLRTAVEQANLYGVSFLKPMFESDLWPDHPPPLDDFDSDEAYREALQQFLDHRSLTFPFPVFNVNPKNLVWDDSITGINWAIEFYQIDARAVRERYSLWTGKETAGQPVTWMEYWDKTHAVFLAGGQVVWEGKHDYGFVPYFPVLPANTPNYGTGLPQERYQGILHGVHSLLDEHARTMTAYTAILRQYAWRTLDFTGPNTQATYKSRDEYELFGGMNVLLPGVEVRASPLAAVPQELFQHLNILDNEIESATFPNIIRGVRPRGVSSGFAVSVLAGLGRLVFQRSADALASAMVNVNKAFLMLVENKVRGKVTVHARSDVHNFDQTISPDDIRGQYENRVRLKAEAPEEREREALLAFRLWNNGNGILSRYEAQRRAGVANPLEEQVLMGAEQLLLMPEIRSQQAALAAERLGLLSQLTQATEPGATGTELSNIGQFMGGQAQLQRPGEAAIQRQRAGTRAAQPGVFPRGLGGLDSLGNILGTPGGGAQGLPSGQTVR